MIDIAGRSIGPGFPTFVIAEAGVSHNGDIRLAEKLIMAAKQAGAQTCKFQTWRTARLLSPDSPAFRTLLPLELSEGQHRHLFAYAAEVGITFLSTPDQAEDADFLDELGVPAFKIGSGHLTDLPFLRHVAAKGKPMVISTGMADLVEVQQAVLAIEDTGNEQIAILHCVSVYPQEPDASRAQIYPDWDPAWCNLRAMDALAMFHYPVGYSEHSPYMEFVLAAVARGASIIERHLRLQEHRPMVDAAVSIDEWQFMEMVDSIRRVEAALGDGVKRPLPEEEEARRYCEEWRR